MARRNRRWLRRHLDDGWVRRARTEGKRSRAAFKLTQIFQEYKLSISRNAVVVDLGCAPGSWCQELVRLAPHGMVVGIDLLPVEPVEGATILQHDFLTPAGRRAIDEELAGRPIDLLLSDMAPEMSGNRIVDQAAVERLNEATIAFCSGRLAAGGIMLMKSFMGDGFDRVRTSLRDGFDRVRVVKPPASRRASRELYLLATGWRAA